MNNVTKIYRDIEYTVSPKHSICASTYFNDIVLPNETSMKEAIDAHLDYIAITSKGHSLYLVAVTGKCSLYPIGIFDDLHEAKDMAKIALTDQPDEYHSTKVLGIELNPVTVTLDHQHGIPQDLPELYEYSWKAGRAGITECQKST